VLVPLDLATRACFSLCPLCIGMRDRVLLDEGCALQF
jgi:hypothetical protein